MEHFLGLLLGAIAWLFGLIAAAIGVIEGLARHALASLGVTGELQTAVLLILLVLLIVAAFRVFGRLFAVLIALVLLVVLLHALLGSQAAGIRL
jgi:hypothetical protein